MQAPTREIRVFSGRRRPALGPRPRLGQLWWAGATLRADASTTRPRSAIAFRPMAIAEPPPQILDLASACLEYVDRALGFTLDFSSDTLGVVDHYATTVRANLAANPSLGPLIGPAVGAYFGEVVRVRFHGFWRVPPNQHDWAVCLRTVFLNINP